MSSTSLPVADNSIIISSEGNKTNQPATITTVSTDTFHSSTTMSSSVPSSTTTVSSTGWIKHISRKTGNPYWFNTKTGVSVWEEPKELQLSLLPVGTNLPPNNLTTITSSTIIPTIPKPDIQSHPSNTATTTHPLSSTNIHVPHYPLTDPRAFYQSNIELLQAKENIPLCRTAIEKICQLLTEGKYTIPEAIGYHRFPPSDNKILKFVIYEMADEYQLKYETIGKDDLKHIVIYHPNYPPIDIQLLQQEEEALEKEAQARKAEEIQAEAMAVARQALHKLEQSRQQCTNSELKSKDEHKNEKLSSSTTLPDLGEIVEVVPLFKKKDKRSISEIQADIKAKKAKLSE